MTSRASWDYADRRRWAAAAAALTAAGVEWPVPLAEQHLCHLQAGVLVFGDTWPSLTELAETFGWRSKAGRPAVKRVRGVLHRWREWSDPARVDEWAAWLATRSEDEGHGEGTVRARSGHDEGTTDHVATPAFASEGHGEGTVRARSGHDEGNTRGPITPTHRPTDPPTHGEQRSARATRPPRHPIGADRTDEDFAELHAAADRLAELRRADLGLVGDLPITERDALASWLARPGVTEDALAALLAALRYAPDDPRWGGDELRYCHGKGIAWSLRNRCDVLPGLAATWDRAGRPSRDEPAPRGRDRPTSRPVVDHAAVDAEVLEILRQKRERAAHPTAPSDLPTLEPADADRGSRHGRVDDVPTRWSHPAR